MQQTTTIQSEAQPTINPQGTTSSKLGQWFISLVRVNKLGSITIVIQ
jgi:hypothetical protein